MTLVRVNVGCGSRPTQGWVNLDNSPSVRLRRLPVGPLIGGNRRAVWEAARANDVKYGRATRLPLRDASAEVVFSSHMLEHLSRRDARAFLRECLRVLAPGGIVRLAVPDLGRLVSEYQEDRDADRLVERLMLADDRAGTGRLIRFIGHRWMYDGASLSRLLTAVGFRDPVVLEPGETTLTDPGPLDLYERAEDSVYVEARR